MGEHPSARLANPRAGMHCRARTNVPWCRTSTQTRICELLTDMSQFPGDKAGPLRAELEKFKLIRRRSHSDGCRRHEGFAVHH